MNVSERYVAAAYVLFLLVLLSYVLIQSRKLARFDHAVAELERRAG
jgi:hypothetical protein